MCNNSEILLADRVLYEAKCWCLLQHINFNSMDDATLMQCATEVASALDLYEDDIEEFLRAAIKDEAKNNQC